MVVPLISFKGVSKVFRKNKVLQNINLSISKGDLFGIIGISGSGKTTLLRTLIGYYRINEGEILFNNENIAKKTDLIKQIFGFTSQDYSFYEKLTLKENLIYFGNLYNIPRKDIKKRADDLLKMVELYEEKDKLAKELSGGMQRRLDIACSLMHSPQILILDEPTTGLDPMLRKHMLRLIKKINDSGTTVIITSHLLGEIEHVCNRVAILHNGQILVENSPEKLKDMYSRNEEIHLETFPAEYEKIVMMLQRNRIPIAYATIRAHKLIVYTPNAESTLHAIIHILENMKETLLDVDVNKPSLSEVFEALTQKRINMPKLNPYEELKANVKSAMAHGYSPQQIESQLLREGYSDRAIKKILGDIR